MPFDEDEGTWTIAGAISDVTGTAAATYGANEQTIVNALTARTNAILAALRDANIIAQD